ncbi:hypothetical protein PAHAL_1G236700 [Panicum hallii]|uniref:Uncharacterized protein n=1 Tax=Panicum hallii TaxID=206008 RepID=A0A2T8KWA1_9POAL|nr:hypothetical protein PAHAL_1G236700 [Panicum hallii]
MGVRRRLELRRVSLVAAMVVVTSFLTAAAHRRDEGDLSPSSFTAAPTTGINHVAAELQSTARHLLLPLRQRRRHRSSKPATTADLLPSADGGTNNLCSSETIVTNGFIDPHQSQLLPRGPLMPPASVYGNLLASAGEVNTEEASCRRVDSDSLNFLTRGCGSSVKNTFVQGVFVIVLHV